jgi:hypothetical protein
MIHSFSVAGRQNHLSEPEGKKKENNRRVRVVCDGSVVCVCRPFPKLETKKNKKIFDGLQSSSSIIFTYRRGRRHIDIALIGYFAGDVVGVDDE